MTDTYERLAEIIRAAGYQRNEPGTMAAILIANGVTFREDMPVERSCQECCYNLICDRSPRSPATCRDYTSNKTTERNVDNETKQTEAEAACADSGDHGHVPSSLRGSGGGRAAGAGAGGRQDDANQPSNHERAAKRVREDNAKAHRTKKQTYIKRRIRVTKDVEGIFPECRPPEGETFDAEIYLTEQGRHRGKPYCIIEYAGKRIVLRAGEYEEL